MRRLNQVTMRSYLFIHFPPLVTGFAQFSASFISPPFIARLLPSGQLCLFSAADRIFLCRDSIMHKLTQSNAPFLWIKRSFAEQDTVHLYQENAATTSSGSNKRLRIPSFRPQNKQAGSAARQTSGLSRDLSAFAINASEFLAKL